MGSHRKTIVAAAVPIGFLLSGALIWQASYAAFTDTTDNPGNSWEAGSVVISDDHGGSALFSETNLVPGSAGTKCIVVSYTGSVDANVSLATTFADVTSDSIADTALAPYLNLTVDYMAGSHASGGTCDGTYTTPVGVYSAVATNAATITNSYAVTAAPPSTTRTYRIAYTLADDNLAQGKAMGLTFTWTATSS